ncbi:hypothetical protein [Flagellimonas marina]|uniref:Uncharacterized protein n=1 Tax=Flagellimonas marina TaxID=1775168 RepID=A0ABV8PFK2_9FLAO
MMGKGGTMLKLLGTSSVAVGLVTILFLTSELQVHRNNAFTRRYPHPPIVKVYDLDLGYSSYYIAGLAKNTLYLGNTTAPLHMVGVNLSTRDTQHIRLRPERTDLPFRSVRVKMAPPHFFIMDGTVSCIFRGVIGKWNADIWMEDRIFFTHALPIDSNRLFIKTISGRTNEAVLGLIKKQDDITLELNPDLLEKQIDGQFDVDGIMAISEDMRTLAHVYFYRNEYMVFDQSLQLLQGGQTIDTINRAQISVATTNAHGQVKMDAPPLFVNNLAALYNNLLLIASPRLGKYEKQRVLDEATIIDVYDWRKETYEFSFHIFNIRDKKVREFNLYGDHLVALIDHTLSVYQLDHNRFQQAKNVDLSKSENTEP